MGKKSRDKGKVGEREAAAFLRDRGYDARRGQQFSGGPGSPDVVHSIPGVHVEVKRAEQLAIYKAMEQAEMERGEGEVPAVLHRRNHCDWVVVMWLEDFLEHYAPEPEKGENDD